MKKMFTIFDLFRLVTSLSMTLAGGVAGNHFGFIGILFGVIIGFIAGCFIGSLPIFWATRAFHKRFSDKSSSFLRSVLHKAEPDVLYPPNFILLELQRRGEDISSELPMVLDLLESEESARRCFGVAAITSAFPDIAKNISAYNSYGTTDECRKSIKLLRNIAKNKLV